MTPLRPEGVVLDAAERAGRRPTAAPMTNVRRVMITFGNAPAVAQRGDILFIPGRAAAWLRWAPSSTIRNVVMGTVQAPNG